MGSGVRPWAVQFEFGTQKPVLPLEIHMVAEIRGRRRVRRARKVGKIILVLVWCVFGIDLDGELGAGSVGWIGCK